MTVTPKLSLKLQAMCKYNKEIAETESRGQWNSCQADMVCKCTGLKDPGTTVAKWVGFGSWHWALGKKSPSCSLQQGQTGCATEKDKNNTTYPQAGCVPSFNTMRFWWWHVNHTYLFMPCISTATHLLYEYLNFKGCPIMEKPLDQNRKATRPGPPGKKQQRQKWLLLRRTGNGV